MFPRRDCRTVVVFSKSRRKTDNTEKEYLKGFYFSLFFFLFLHLKAEFRDDLGTRCARNSLTAPEASNLSLYQNVVVQRQARRVLWVGRYSGRKTNTSTQRYFKSPLKLRAIVRICLVFKPGTWQTLSCLRSPCSLLISMIRPCNYTHKALGLKKTSPQTKTAWPYRKAKTCALILRTAAFTGLPQTAEQWYSLAMRLMINLWNIPWG